MKIQGKTADEIVESVRSLITVGVAQPGDRLPAVRQLALELNVNRNTAAAAYRRLNETGLTTNEGRRGTRIALPPSAGEQEGLNPNTVLVDLADGNPDPAQLPDLNQVPSQCKFKHSLYGEDTLNTNLRCYGKAWFREDCPPNFDFLVTHGCVDAIERLARAQLVPGDRVAVEDPCFLGTINALRLSAMHTVGVQIDAAGMRPESLRSALESGARAVLITARAQNPTGCSMTAERAQAIALILADYPDALVIVDDHFALLSETTYHSPIPDSTASWVVIRSVAKALGPDFRLALLACDPATGGRLRTWLAPGMTWVSHFLQTMAAYCLDAPDIKRRLASAKAQYAQARQDMTTTLQQSGIETPLTVDGLNVWIPVPCDEESIVDAMTRRGWLVRSSSAYDVQRKNRAIRVTVSRLKHGDIVRFATDFAAVLEENDKDHGPPLKAR